MTPLSGSSGAVRAVALQADGKIVVAGGVKGSNGYYDFALIRYHANGTLDQTFGSDGMVSTDFDGHDDEAVGLAIQPDGKIVVLGRIDSSVVLARYLSR